MFVNTTTRAVYVVWISLFKLVFFRAVNTMDAAEAKNTNVVISKSTMDRLIKETKQLEQFLPKVLTPEILHAPVKIQQLQKELETLKKELEAAVKESKQCQQSLTETQKELQQAQEEKFSFKCELQEMGQQLSQQSEYCATMGAAACTLLWRVSRSDESVQAILAGTKTKEFLDLVASTLESYIQTYKEEVPEDNEEETQFVLALCGVVTNIAASACGREHLMSNAQGRHLVDTFLTVLSESPNKKCAKLKNLMLMSLYNLSINLKGLKYISSKPNILALLVWLVQDSQHMENRVHAIKLIQSLVYDPNSSSIQYQAREQLTAEALHHWSRDPNKEVRELALELRNDLCVLLPPSEQ